MCEAIGSAEDVQRLGGVCRGKLPGSPALHTKTLAMDSLHLALRTRQGKLHPLSDLRAWIEQARLIPGEVIALDTSREMGALVAHAPPQESSTRERHS